MAGRRRVAMLVGFVLALSALTPVSAAPVETSRAPAAKASRLTLAVSADEVDYGSRVTLSGKLTGGGKGLRRQKVVLMHRPGGSRTWARVGTVTTASGGAWKKAVVGRVRGAYTAVFKGTKAYKASRAAERGVDVFAPLTAFAVQPGGRDAYRDEDWTWTARTAPELAGSSVELVRGPARTPTTVATGTIGPRGAITLTHRMAQVGRWEYRVSVDSSALMYGVTSAPSLVRTRAERAPSTPSITTSTLPAAELHAPYEAVLVASGGEITWSLVDGTLPPGLALDPDGVLTGASTSTGSWSFTVRAANVAGSATRELSLTSAPGSLTVTTYPLTDAAVGEAYPDGSYSSGGFQSMECTPCSEYADWRVAAGTLPPGLSLGYDDWVGMTYIYGTPTQAGRYEFTVSVSADGHSGVEDFSILVLPHADDRIRIDYNPFHESVPHGTRSQPYSHQFTAAGETGLTWTSLSSLPPGLTLSNSGLLSGTPSVSGSGWIAVAATDGTRYDWQAFQLQVDEPADRAAP